MTAAALALVALLAADPSASPQTPTPTLTPESAAPVFDLAKVACERDGGALWNQSLCGPILLVDPRSRTLVASQADGEGRLTASGSVWIGSLPTELSPANTALDWAGVRWSLVMWPLSADPADQARLLLHELFHRIQGEIRLPAGNPVNAHLDTETGRVWLQLEWRALAKAYRVGVNQGRKDALVDALAFRARRWSLFPEGRADEIALEKNEGLAEYTGIVLSGDASTARRNVSANLEKAPQAASFVRSFAYASGPAYGLFLDSLRPAWRREMVNPVVDQGRLLALSLGFSIEEWQALAATAPERAARYGFVELAATEHRREVQRVAQRASLRARLVDGRVLHLPFERMTITFDPGEVVVLQGVGSVYPGARITDAWGVLTVTDGGALIDAAWSCVQVTASSKPRLRDGVLRGEGWTLELAPGWRLQKSRKRWSVAKKH